MVKKDISRLRKNRSIHFQIGLCAALFFSFTCLNWTTFKENPVDRSPEMTVDDLTDLEITRTAYPKEIKLPPPTKMKPNIEIIPDEDPPKIEFEPIEKPVIEVAHDAKIVKTQPAPPPAPAPPPPPKKETEIIWKIVEEMPRFGDCRELNSRAERQKCSDKKLMEYIYSEVKYPAIARENGLQGNVIVSFVVDKNGKVSSPKIQRDIGGGCGEEVLRIINKMPDWSPGEQRGRKVKVQYNLPVKFSLQ